MAVLVRFQPHAPIHNTVVITTKTIYNFLMEFDNATTNTKQGDMGEARAIYEYTRLGYTVLTPLTDSDKFDIVIYDGEKFLRVQSKTSTQKKKGGGYEVQLRQTGGNTKKHTSRNRHENDYDILFVLLEDGRCFSIPAPILNKATVSIIVGNTKYNEYQI